MGDDRRRQAFGEEVEHLLRIVSQRAEKAVEEVAGRDVVAAVVERHRIEGEAFGTVREDQIRHALVEDEHRVPHAGRFALCAGGAHAVP